MVEQSNSSRQLSAGVARVVITPPVGIRMLGYTVQECVSESIERDLTATALILTDGITKVALLACDLVFIQNPQVDRIRERIGARLEIPASHVMINCSHTHLGPMFGSWQPSDSPEQLQMQQRYLEILQELLPGVAAAADHNRRPARIGAGKGSAVIGMNRRERLPDGRVIIGENPAGPVDHEVGVIRIDDLTGKALATIMSAAAHTVVLGPKTPQLSPDYVGPARDIIERATGAPSLFFLGAAGNVNPRYGIGGGGAEQFDDLQRLGSMLGGEALKIWAGIRTHNRQGPRRIVQSVATVSTWDYEPTPKNCIEHFDLNTRRLTIPLAPLPDQATAEKQLQHYRGKLEEAQQSGASRGAIQVAQRLLHWSEVVLRAAESGKPALKQLEMWALRINDIGIVAVSGEPFAELSLEVKQRSPLPQTFFLGYTNGCIGYLPTPEAFAEGGMEVHESYQNYLLPAPLTPEWGPAIIKNSLEMLESLT